MGTRPSRLFRFGAVNLLRQVKSLAQILKR
jgi:hypothetical protein